METYHVSLKPYGIGVTAFCPGNMNTNIHEAAKTRPAHLQNSGYYEDDVTAEAYRKHNVLGLEIREVGEHVMKGIEQGVVIYIPNEDREDIMKVATQRMMDYMTPEGMKKQAEMEGAPPAEMPPEELASIAEANKVGWGKAKSDIDWVSDNKKYGK